MTIVKDNANRIITNGLDLANTDVFFCRFAVFVRLLNGREPLQKGCIREVVLRAKRNAQSAKRPLAYVRSYGR